MLQNFESDTRVQLSGIVGSIPGLLGKSQFVLHTPDGRGLLVHGNSKQPSPPYGSSVNLTGSIIINDDGTYLQMRSSDRWHALGSRTDVQPRAVDLIAPRAEDAWSLVDITATVQQVNAKSVNLDAGDIPLFLNIRPVVKYRTQRLSVGDVVRIRGLLDTRGEDAKIYPRTNDEITIVSHAEQKKPAPAATSSVPPWTPFGSAGVTVGIVQGIKRYRKFREQKRLSKLLAEATQHLA
jgi:hypothetical protein